ncbi:MAG: hypothetical protein JSR36_12645 [Proteobacteria bacterium]|nr:hypothetical protein [Pseudomonadota bacterium]
MIVACALAAPSTYAGQRNFRNLSISGTPPTSVTAGQSYTFTPSVNAPRSRTLVYAIANQPAWASFSTATGQLSGTPGATSVGTYSNIVIAVSDGTNTATLNPFSVQVVAASTTLSAPAPAPILSGTPPTSVVAGSAYSFQPTASDPSGLTLSFSVQNLPAWAAFSIASGQIYGTPTSTQTGTYANIVISASDGTTASSMPAFSVTVTSPPAVTGTAVLSLTPPTQNTDGSALTNLAGMHIYYGNSASSMTQMIDVPGTAPTSYTLSNLASGSWYFAATAYTTDGLESSPSPTQSKTIS